MVYKYNSYTEEKFWKTNEWFQSIFGPNIVTILSSLIGFCVAVSLTLAKYGEAETSKFVYATLFGVAGIIVSWVMIWLFHFVFLAPSRIWREQKTEISELTPRRLKLTELSPVALEIYQEISTIESRYGGWPPQKATDEMLSSLRDKETYMSDQTLSRFIDELRTCCDQRNKMRTAYPDNFSITNADIKNEEGFCLLYNQFNAYILLYCRAIKERLLGEQDFEYIDSMQRCVDGYSFNGPNQVSVKLSETGVEKIMDNRRTKKMMNAIKEGDIVK